MSVFISWSGKRSERAASALSFWFKSEVESFPVWMSSSEIAPGDRWGKTLHEQLKRSSAGVLCVTPDNLHSPWLMYEAGALAIATKNGNVIPYLIDIEPSTLPAPLLQFQYVNADRNGTRDLVDALTTGALSEETRLHLLRRFDETWESLAHALGFVIEVTYRDGIVILETSAIRMGEDLGKQLTARIAAELLKRQPKFLLDLSSADEVADSALGFLFAGLAAAHQKDADVAVTFGESLRQKFASAGVLSIVRYFSTREAALQYFADEGKHGHSGGETDILTAQIYTARGPD